MRPVGRLGFECNVKHPSNIVKARHNLPCSSSLRSCSATHTLRRIRWPETTISAFARVASAQCALPRLNPSRAATQIRAEGAAASGMVGPGAAARFGHGGPASQAATRLLRARGPSTIVKARVVRPMRSPGALRAISVISCAMKLPAMDRPAAIRRGRRRSGRPSFRRALDETACLPREAERRKVWWIFDRKGGG